MLSIALTVGGGVRRVEDAQMLLEAGADKVAINTAAVRDPSVISGVASRFGSQCTVLSVDAAMRGEGWEVVVESGTVRTGIDVVSWCVQATEQGAGEILLTSWDRDGTHLGYDTRLTESVTKAVNVPVIASGGAETGSHVLEAVDAGASAALLASVLHDGRRRVDEIKSELAGYGIEVRR